MKISQIITVLCLFCNINSFAQDAYKSIDLVTGFGYPEIVHIGVKAQISQRNQIGIYYGNALLFSSDDYYHSFTLDHQYHFGKLSKFENRQVFFTRQGLSYINYEDSYSKTTNFVCVLTAGREFNITKRVGVCADLGIKVFLYQDRIIKDESLEPMFDFSSSDNVLLPVFRVQLLYSL